MRIKVELGITSDWNIYTLLVIFIKQRGKFFQIFKKIHILRISKTTAQPKPPPLDEIDFSHILV